MAGNIADHVAGSTQDRNVEWLKQALQIAIKLEHATLPIYLAAMYLLFVSPRPFAYRKAERELGVAADVDEQRYHGLTFPDGYDYPMRRLPPSDSDRKLAEAIDGMEVSLGESTYAVEVRKHLIAELKP